MKYIMIESAESHNSYSRAPPWTSVCVGRGKLTPQNDHTEKEPQVGPKRSEPAQRRLSQSGRTQACLTERHRALGGRLAHKVHIDSTMIS
jgi:hypothetical protein